MGDGIGTNDEVLWLGYAEAALFGALIRAVEAGDYFAADNWVGLLERLSIV